MTAAHPGRWRDQGACRGEDPGLWFPSDRRPHFDQIALAKAICGRCPVRETCLQWAETTPELYGIWGGLTEQERAAARHREARQVDAEAAAAAEHRAVLLRELDAYEAAHSSRRLSRSRWRDTPPEPQLPVFTPVTADEAARNRALLEAELSAVENRGRGRAA